MITAMAAINLVLVTNTYSLAQPAGSGVCEREIFSAAKRHQVPLGILYAVALTESGRAGELQPFALNVEGQTFFPATQRAAKEIFSREHGSGKRLIDIGCMQINYKYHASQFTSLDAMFDPRRNVEYASSFLHRLKQRHGSWVMAVARYHAGANNNVAQRKYVCTVLRHMVQQGFAKPTGEAKKTCKNRQLSRFLLSRIFSEIL